MSCIISPEAGNHYFYHYIHTHYLKISVESNASTFVRVCARLEVRYYSCFVLFCFALLCFSFLFVTLRPTLRTIARESNNSNPVACDKQRHAVGLRLRVAVCGDKKMEEITRYEERRDSSHRRSAVAAIITPAARVGAIAIDSGSGGCTLIPSAVASAIPAQEATHGYRVVIRMYVVETGD